MLAGYLTDIEQLLDEQHRDAALREAFDLPRIAVALTDPQLRCSGEQMKTWCEQWIGPPGTERRAHPLDYERVGRNVSERVTQQAAAAPLPAHAVARFYRDAQREPCPPGDRSG
jgi:hypothetical protein